MAISVLTRALAVFFACILAATVAHYTAHAPRSRRNDGGDTCRPFARSFLKRRMRRRRAHELETLLKSALANNSSDSITANLPTAIMAEARRLLLVRHDTALKASVALVEHQRPRIRTSGGDGSSSVAASANSDPG